MFLGVQRTEIYISTNNSKITIHLKLLYIAKLKFLSAAVFSSTLIFHVIMLYQTLEACGLTFSLRKNIGLL